MELVLLMVLTGMLAVTVLICTLRPVVAQPSADFSDLDTHILEDVSLSAPVEVPVGREMSRSETRSPR